MIFVDTRIAAIGIAQSYFGRLLNAKEADAFANANLGNPEVFQKRTGRSIAIAQRAAEGSIKLQC